VSRLSAWSESCQALNQQVQGERKGWEAVVLKSNGLCPFDSLTTDQKRTFCYCSKRNG